MTDDPYRVLRQARSHRPDVEPGVASPHVLTDRTKDGRQLTKAADCICPTDEIDPACPFHNLTLTED